VPLSADDIRLAFAALSEELGSQQERAEIVVVGGAALVIFPVARSDVHVNPALFALKEEESIRPLAKDCGTHRADPNGGRPRPQNNT
jgi:hypothetical protein